MNPWILFAWTVTVGSVAGLAAVLGWMYFAPRRRRTGSPRMQGSGLEGDRAGISQSAFSPARYQVMERLLSSRDAQFLSTQKGFTPADGKRWKRDSLRIFRLYLCQLTRDFHALHARARALMVASGSESPELAATLVRQQAAFWRARLALEGRLLLLSCGVGTVDVAPLLRMIEAMQVDLSRLIPEPAQGV